MCKLLVLANAQLGHQRTKHDRIVTITTLHTSPIRGTAFLNPAEDLQPGRQLTCVSKLNYKHYPSPKDYIREDILMVLNQVHPSRCATSNPSQQGPSAWGLGLQTSSPAGLCGEFCSDASLPDWLEGGGGPLANTSSQKPESLEHGQLKTQERQEHKSAMRHGNWWPGSARGIFVLSSPFKMLRHLVRCRNERISE